MRVPMLHRFLLAALLPMLALFVACSGQPVQADVLTLGPDQRDYPLGMHMDVLEDKTASLDIEAVSSAMYAGRFHAVGKERPNYGFRRAALWFRIQIDFSGSPEHEWHLIESHPIIDEITFYTPDGFGGWNTVPMGDTLAFDARPYKLREFVLPIPYRLIGGKTQPASIFVRVAGQGALNVDLRLTNAQGLAERTSMQLWGFGLFYGALLVMLLYNALLYWSTRERAQLHYIIFLAGFILLFLSLDGLALQYLWPDFPAANGWFPVFTCIAVWGALQFTRSFLDIRKDNPKVDAGFRWMTHAVVLVFLLGLMLPRHWAYILGTVLPLLFAMVMFGAGVMRLRQGYRPARLFVAGWCVLLSGAILLPLANLGILPANVFTTYSPQFGAVLQVVLLSLALGDRMKLLKVENERIQQESHEQLERMFAQIKNLDADKLRFLHYLSHELNTPLNWMSATRTVDATTVHPEIRAMIEMVEAGHQRMIDLVSTVLRYFDLASENAAQITLAPIAPMWVIDELLRERVDAIAKKKLTLRNSVPADLVLFANEQRLRRALAFLIENAINYSDEGQEIVVSGGTETYGTRGVLVVRDHGKGIDGEHIGRLFEPFFMVGSHHREGGFGLSLATARLLVANMGGDMRVRSEGRGQGAEFSIILPIAASANPRPTMP